jgi:hypothetical protein
MEFGGSNFSASLVAGEFGGSYFMDDDVLESRP